VYSIVEHFKFYRSFPLRQKDLPEEALKNKHSKLTPVLGVDVLKIGDLMGKMESPMCDFTPPNLITLLVTDSGIMTPSAVSDELIQMFEL